MAPLISFEEALELGELTDRERDRRPRRARLEGAPGELRRLDRHVLPGQRQVRRLRRGLRLLRPVALRRGRHADARDDGAGADPRARQGGRGRRRPPLLHGHPGPGPLEARLRQDPRGCEAGLRADQPEALRLDRPHVRRSGRSSCARRAIQRVHHNVESARSHYPEVSTTVRYEGRLRTIRAVKEAGLETCVGGILNLGESKRQRVEMAFELSEINPTSVPINLLNPREGTKFGDRPLMDPWEVVKWVAIFRLIIPGALFRLCGGRVENLGELQPLAVRAGLNGVMMGNFLTTLGAEPADDRAMFDEQGLNVARQPDNGANPRPDNRAGWLEGETPATPMEELIDHQDEANFWDPSTQLRVIRKTRKPPPYPGRHEESGAGEAAAWWADDRDRRAPLRAPRQGPAPAAAADRRPAGAAGAARRAPGAAAVLEQLPRPRRPSPGAPGRRRGGDALGRRRRRLAADLGEHEAAPPARGAPGRLQGLRGGAPVRLRLPGEHRRDRGAGRAPARSSSPTSSTTPASSTAAGSRAPRPSSTATATSSTSPGGCAGRASGPR